MPFGAPSKPAPQKRGLGCAGCGCGLLILIILLLIAIGYGFYHQALNLTNTAATPVPQVDAGPTVYTTAQHKIGDFQQAITHVKPATLHLTSDEINTYIARDPSMAAVRGRLFVRLNGDEATLQSSIPLGAFESVVMSDRYVDCNATLSLAFDPQDKNILVTVHSISLKGQTVPSSANASLSQTINSTLAHQLQANGPMRDFLARTQKITIENSELVIETR